VYTVDSGEPVTICHRASLLLEDDLLEDPIPAVEFSPFGSRDPLRSPKTRELGPLLCDEVFASHLWRQHFIDPDDEPELADLLLPIRHDFPSLRCAVGHPAAYRG
jgi:hypothetical protein